MRMSWEGTATEQWLTMHREDPVQMASDEAQCPPHFEHLATTSPSTCKRSFESHQIAKLAGRVPLKCKTSMGITTRCDKPWVAHYNLYRMIDHPTQIQELEVHLKISFCPASLAEARSKLETRKAWWRCWNCRTSTSFTNFATPRRFLEIWHGIEHWLMQQEEQKWENKTDSSHYTSEAWWNKMSSPSSAKIHCTCFQWMGSVSKRTCRWTATKQCCPNENTLLKWQLGGQRHATCSVWGVTT